MTWLTIIINPNFLALAVFALVFSGWANLKIKLTFRKYNRIGVASGLTGAEAARMILDDHGLERVKIKCIEGNLTDYYDPRKKTLFLSKNVYDNPSIAAVGVAAHEAGHAIQHARHYIPVMVRTAIVPITNFGSRLAIPTALAGIFLQREEYVTLGIVMFGMLSFFQFITLPVEFDASRRAVTVLQDCGYVQSGKELKGVKKVLTAAILTYVAALISALVNLVRFIIWISFLGFKK